MSVKANSSFHSTVASSGAPESEGLGARLQQLHVEGARQVIRLERSPEKVGRTAAIVAGLIGTGYLVAAIVSFLTGGLDVSFFMLAAVAVAHMILPMSLKGKFRAKRAVAVAPRLAVARQAAADTLAAANYIRSAG